MNGQLKIYNSLSRQKEVFEPINAPLVGLYVCGPTVYGDPHLGHSRPAITFDTVFRYLKHKGYKVRYVRNITDVGHMEDEVAGTGEDKIAKKAKLEQLEPMEIVHYYTRRYHAGLRALNTLPPSIEPTASGHIIEQIEMVQQLLAKGYAYESKGNIYFDIQKYNSKYHYGTLSGRSVEDMLSGTRTLDGQETKRHQADFALWKKATPEHIMQWDSPWGKGFPGWHLECSVMSTKYLGAKFDIHGGGMDLLFPHHECEIAQSTAACGHTSAKYWMHNNMITINGQKMGKSLGNFITLEALFTGHHELLEQAYSPMAIRLLILGAHYRSTIDFSNKALQDAEKGYKRLLNALNLLEKLTAPTNTIAENEQEDQSIQKTCTACYEHMDDDFHTAQVVADLFELSSKINAFYNKQLPINAISMGTFEQLKTTYQTFFTEILGLVDDSANNGTAHGYVVALDGVMNLLLDLRSQARKNRDWATSDKIRHELTALNIVIKDGKEGTSWNMG